MAQVVADSSGLIGLQQIGQLTLLHGLFDEIAVSPIVAREVSNTLPQLPSWIRVQTLSHPIPTRIADRRLGPGETEALALALEIGINRVILDDLPARGFARQLGFEVIGTGAVLYKAKVRGLIPAVRPLLDALLANGFRLSQQVYRQILVAAGEAE